MVSDHESFAKDVRADNTNVTRLSVPFHSICALCFMQLFSSIFLVSFENPVYLGGLMVLEYYKLQYNVNRKTRRLITSTLLPSITISPLQEKLCDHNIGKATLYMLFMLDPVTASRRSHIDALYFILAGFVAPKSLQTSIGVALFTHITAKPTAHQAFLK